MLDWQMITYSSPTNDIALLITSSLPSSIRRQHTGKLLDLYYNLLKANCHKLSLDIEVDLQYSRNKMECDFRWAWFDESSTTFVNVYVSRKSQLLSFLLCIGSIDVALGHSETEQRLLDVLQDFYKDNIFAFDDKDLFDWILTF